MKSKQRLIKANNSTLLNSFALLGDKHVQVLLYEIVDNQKREREFLIRREVLYIYISAFVRFFASCSTRGEHRRATRNKGKDKVKEK